MFFSVGNGTGPTTRAPVRVTDKALLHIINHYTLEAGFRTLERHIATVMRKVAKEMTSAEIPMVEKAVGK